MDSKAVIGGANVLLAALASYWTGEKIPDRLFTETANYNIRHMALRPGSIETDEQAEAIREFARRRKVPPQEEGA